MLLLQQESQELSHGALLKLHRSQCSSMGLLLRQFILVLGLILWGLLWCFTWNRWLPGNRE